MQFLLASFKKKLTPIVTFAVNTDAVLEMKTKNSTSVRRSAQNENEKLAQRSRISPIAQKTRQQRNSRLMKCPRSIFNLKSLTFKYQDHMPTQDAASSTN